MERVGMGGWLNFSSDHVEPIKADHGTQPPPPTSSTFFVLSLFPPRVLAFIHPLSAPSVLTTPHEREHVLFLGSALFPLSRSVPPCRSRTPGHPLRPDAARPPPSTSSSSSCRSCPLALSLVLWQLVGFFRVTRRCNLFGRGRERHPRRWSTKCARGLGYGELRGLLEGEGEEEQRRVSRENRWRRQR